MQIYPSLISANDLLNLEQAIKDLSPFAQGYHVDIMDDHFVPNLTWGAAFANAILAATDLPVHIHLMVNDPTRWIDRVKMRAIDTLILHYESFASVELLKAFLLKLKEKEIRCGIAIKPATAVDVLETCVQNIATVLIMTVEPGFSGQTFRNDIVHKIPQLISLREIQQLHFTIGIDGGVHSHNIAMLKDLGVDYVGIASAIFNTPRPAKTLEQLNQLCR